MKKLIPLILVLMLPSCASWRNYTGPTIRFSAGFEGVDVGVSIIGRRGATGAEMVEAIKRLNIFEVPDPKFTPQPESLSTK